MRKASFWFVLLTLLALPAWAGEAARPSMAANAVLVGWDGAHRDHIKALLKEGKLPNLQKLVSQGALVDIDVTSGATDTKAGWTQILTGYRPEVTGVYSNGKFRDVPAGYSIFERLKAQFGAERIAAVAAIGKKGHCGAIDPPFKKAYDPTQPPPATAPKKGGKKKANQEAKKAGKKAQTSTAAMDAAGMPTRIVEENGVKYLVFDGMPYYTMHKSCDEWIFGLTEDQRVGDTALQMLDKYGKKPFFFFVHFAEVDHSGHGHGEPSKEYNDAIISGDRQLGRIVEKLKQLGVYEKTLIYVTADHGFNVGETNHRYAPYVFLATNDKQVIRNGTRADITPTILDRLGVDLAKIEPKLDGESLSRPAVKPVEKAPPTSPTRSKEGKAG